MNRYGGFLGGLRRQDDDSRPVNHGHAQIGSRDSINSISGAETREVNEFIESFVSCESGRRAKPA